MYKKERVFICTRTSFATDNIASASLFLWQKVQMTSILYFQQLGNEKQHSRSSNYKVKVLMIANLQKLSLKTPPTIYF